MARMGCAVGCSAPDDGGFVASPHRQRTFLCHMAGGKGIASGLAVVLAVALLRPTPVVAAGVVGNGTPASCTEDKLDAALAGGGLVTFNCGPAPVTVTITSTKAITALLAYLRARKPDLDFRGTERLFVGQKQNHRDQSFRLSPNSIAHLFRRLYARAGIVGASSHSGRRWFMTELARHGIHPRILQKRAGHSSLATTQRYIEVTPDQERRAVRAIRL